MSDVPAGMMRLFTLVRPVWRPGTHFLWLQQTVTEPGHPTPLIQTTGGNQSEFVFQVTGPRTTLPPEEILGCYPASGATEASDTCLPHIVLRRRTLPWERALTSTSPNPALQPPPDTPWLALLLLPSSVATIEAAPLSAVYSGAELTALGLDGTTVCDQLVVPRGWLRAVMPRKQDLALLTHARQLSLTDREAQKDDDGFLALVMADRLPTPGIEHLACLVSLEGQWDYTSIWPGATELQPVSFKAGGGGASFAGGGGGPQQPPPVPLPSPGDVFPVRLVVLHSWKFTAGAGGDFEATMQKIGTAGVQRFAAAVSDDAGFVTLDRVNRAGETETALYRGPITPVALARDPEVATSADAALEQEAAGDAVVSHAAAFELGRLLTLSSDDAMTALLGWRGDAQSRKASDFLLADRFKPLAEKILSLLPANAEEIYTTMWQGPPALDQKQLELFAGDPSGIAHLMETVPGLTWSVLAQFKPELLSVDFSSVRSIDAHVALGSQPWQVPPVQVPGIDLGSMPLADPGLSAALDVGFHDLMHLAVDVEAP
jgi:hypothetical protein